FGVYISPPPKSLISEIVSEIESLRRSFFWGGSKECRKIDWVAWEKVISPRDKMVLAPKSVISELESLRRSFFWGGPKEDRKVAWVACEKVISPRDQGGLGIGSLRVSNLAMLAKWWWHFLNEEDSIWCKVIRSLHGPDGGLIDNSTSSLKSGCWFNVVKLKDDLYDIGINLTSLFKKKIGNGLSTRFWLDSWLGGSSLCTTFSRLFRLDSNPNSLPSDRSLIPNNNSGNTLVPSSVLGDPDSSK
nr:RNA-directed DNA polymerase, eukaryota, reverse transcriptase zinc-binding domain protein [Tanacetum cinerariifolium]